MVNSYGFEAMGKPIPWSRREAADKALEEMGVVDSEVRWNLLGRVVRSLEADKPQAAIAHALLYTDPTGAYQLLAHLLTDPA